MCAWPVSIGLCDWSVTMELEMERKSSGQGLVRAGGGLRWSPRELWCVLQQRRSRVMVVCLSIWGVGDGGRELGADECEFLSSKSWGH